MALAPDGTIFVVDRDNNRIQKFDSQGNYLTAWFEWDEFDGDQGLTHLMSPGGSPVDDQGFVYISDIEPEHDRTRVTKFDGNGNYILHWGPSQGGSIFDRTWHLTWTEKDIPTYWTSARSHPEIPPAAGNVSRLHHPGHLGIRGPVSGSIRSSLRIGRRPPERDVYITDAFRNLIQKFSKDGGFLCSGECRDPVPVSSWSRRDHRGSGWQCLRGGQRQSAHPEVRRERGIPDGVGSPGSSTRTLSGAAGHCRG